MPDTYPISHVRVLEPEPHPQEEDCGQLHDDAGAPDGWRCRPFACSQPADCPLNA